MNRQAFADIEMISVRVEERLGVKGPGSWRVHEYSGFDAIPARLRAAFGSGEAAQAQALVLDIKIRELYQQRKELLRFEEPYEVAGDGEAEKAVTVERTVTISVRYRRPRVAARRAA